MTDQVFQAPCEDEEPDNLSPFQRFEAGLKLILAVPKEQVEEAMQEAQKERLEARKEGGSTSDNP